MAAGGAASTLLFLFVVLVVPALIPEHKPLPEMPRRDVQAIQLVLEEEDEEDEETPDHQRRQIVSVNAPATEEVPDSARFEDRVNRSVEEETVGPRANPGRQAAIRAWERQPLPRERTEPREQQERQTGPTAEDAPVQEPEDQVALTPRPDAETPNRRETREVQDTPRQREVLDLSSFSPTMGSAADFIAVPGMSEMDHLDLPQGDRTQINSIENLYWSYWDRVKTQVRPHWRPARIYRQRDPTGRVFGVEDRYTVLRVTLNGDGSLRHVFLERSSDLDFLDREAIRAIEDAEPFANVPEGLKDSRGLLSFRFGFFFEVGSTNFRIRREGW